MKWTKEEVERLKVSVSEGKTYNELSIIFNRTKNSLLGKVNELGLTLNVEYKEVCICKECKIEFKGFKKENRKFCSSSCSAKYNNKNKEPYSKEKRELINAKVRAKLLGKKKSVEVIEKISGEKNGRYDHNKVRIVKNVPSRKINTCRNCSEKIEQKYKIICNKCRLSYYKFYRPSCEFKFNLSEYPNRFDFSLIEKYGWYKAKNRGNNLNGVSRDHMYSVKEGFINNVDPSIISHPANCKLLVHSDNNKKKTTSSITLEELLDRIEKW